MISVEVTASTSSVPPAEQDKPSARAHVPDQREGYHRPIYRVVSKCALSKNSDRAHYPRFPIIRGNSQSCRYERLSKKLSRI